MLQSMGSQGAPPPPQDPSPLRCTLASSLRSPAEGEGHEGFPLPPEKELDPVTREPGRAPPRHAHGDLTSLAPHERLPEILVVPREPRLSDAPWQVP